MPSIDLGKLVQASITKHIEENTYDSFNGSNNMDSVQESLSKTFSKLKDSASDFGSDLKNKAKDTFDTIKDKSSDLADKVKDKAEDAAEAATKGAKKAGEFIQDHPKASAGVAAGAGLLGAGLAARKFVKSRKK